MTPGAYSLNGHEIVLISYDPHPDGGGGRGYESAPWSEVEHYTHHEVAEFEPLDHWPDWWPEQLRPGMVHTFDPRLLERAESAEAQVDRLTRALASITPYVYDYDAGGGYFYVCSACKARTKNRERVESLKHEEGCPILEAQAKIAAAQTCLLYTSDAADE